MHGKGSCLNKATNDVMKKTKDDFKKISLDSGNPLDPKDTSIGRKFWDSEL
jgi:hypothetical protein